MEPHSGRVVIRVNTDDPLAFTEVLVEIQDDAPGLVVEQAKRSDGAGRKV